MRESWRWFGPGDPVTIEDIRQIGATDVVSALHDIPAGEVWAIEAIQEHKAFFFFGPLDATQKGIRNDSTSRSAPSTDCSCSLKTDDMRSLKSVSKESGSLIPVSCSRISRHFANWNPRNRSFDSSPEIWCP